MKVDKKIASRWKALNADEKSWPLVNDIHFPKFSIMREWGKEPDGITQSLITTFLKCKRQFLFQLNRFASDKKQKNFAFGTITHEMLDRIYAFYQRYHCLPKNVLIKKWVDHFDEDKKDWLRGEETDEIRRFKEVCFVMVTEYIKFYRDDFKPGRLLGAEDLFDIHWNSYRLRGKKDLRFQIKGSRWIMETKTASRIDEEELQQKIVLDFQNLFYVHCEEVESGKEVAGVLYNIVRNPGLKFKESISEYCSRLRVDVQKRPAFYFIRFEAPYTKADKAEFRKDLLVMLEEINTLIKSDRSKAYKNPRSCIGRFSCSFLPACASGKLIGFHQSSSLFKELEGQ